MKHKQLLRFGLQFASGTMLSRVLGLARDVLIAATFGASSASDAFLSRCGFPICFGGCLPRAPSPRLLCRC